MMSILLEFVRSQMLSRNPRMQTQWNVVFAVLLSLKGHCIEFKYYADGIHSGLTPPG